MNQMRPRPVKNSVERAPDSGISLLRQSAGLTKMESIEVVLTRCDGRKGHPKRVSGIHVSARQHY